MTLAPLGQLGQRNGVNDTLLFTDPLTFGPARWLDEAAVAMTRVACANFGLWSGGGTYSAGSCRFRGVPVAVMLEEVHLGYS